MEMIRTYSELIRLNTFEERFNYLRLDGLVGEETFGFDRYLNQVFYRSSEWRSIRDYVLIRDGGCDLAMSDRPINGMILVHHMNPISKNDILLRNKRILDPEFLICTVRNTHNAIHYGDENLLTYGPVERKPNDTCPWKKEV